VGKSETCLWFSTFHPLRRRPVGNVGIAQRFPRPVGSGFCSPSGRHFHRPSGWRARIYDEDVAEIGEVVKRYGVVGLCALTLLFVVLHPSPWRVGCDTETPFQHAYSKIDDVLQIWLIVVPALAATFVLRKSWISAVFVVFAQLVGHLAAGEPSRDFEGTEAPLIVLIGLPVSFVSLFAGHATRRLFNALRVSVRALTP
jgi:hypothetical protein